MADGYISEIKLPNNQTYLLKDSESVHRNSELLTTNPFAPVSLKGPYISKIDNAFYAADKRWTVTGTNISTISPLFDGNYESNGIISAGKTATITIDFDPNHNNSAYFPGYPYGYILISFYYTSGPSSVSARVYCNYNAHGIGWHNISFSPINDNTNGAIVYKSEHQGYYNISQLEITIVAGSAEAKPTQIEMHLDRPNSALTPFLSKYNAETLYYNLTAPKFIGALQGNADSATAATKFSSAQSVTLTGDVTGTASSQAGWSIATTIGTGKVTNAMLAGSIANGKLANSKITIAGNDVSLGGSLAASTLTESLGLSKAMSFLGVATVAITDGGTEDPKIGGNATTVKAGDVVIDSSSSREYVWSTTNKWELLGGDSSYWIASTDTAAKFWRGDNVWSDTISGGTLKIANHDLTLEIGAQNSSWVHFTSGANFYFNHQINAVDGFKVYNTSTSLTNNNLTFAQGGGWSMSDSTWIRTVGSKSIYQNAGTLRTDGTFQIGEGGKYVQFSSSGIKLGDSGTAVSNNANLITVNGHMVINGSYNTSNSYNEGLRINRSTNGWSVLTLGGTQGTTSSAGLGVWLIGALSSPANATTAAASITDSKFYISYNGSNSAACRITGHNATGFSIRPRLTVNADVDTNYAFKVAGMSWLQGPLRIGNADTAGTETGQNGYASANSGSTNYIAFYGVYGDNPGGFNHTYIGESIYGPKDTANEKSELLLFKGNDVNGSSGPDRIRLFANEIDIQVYTSTLYGTWDTIRATTGTQVANFKNGQVTINGNVTATTFTGDLTGNATNITGTVAIDHGGTGATDAAGARTNLGLGTIATKADTAYVKYAGNITGIGSASPASGAQTWWKNTTNVPKLSIVAAYNNSGSEKTLIFSKGNADATYGSILMWGYSDRYLRILRKSNSNADTWSTTDWEKIDAGYADSAGSTQLLQYRTQVTTLEQVDTFGTTDSGYMKVAKVSKFTGQSGTWTNNDGILINIPWSNTYGHEIFVNDNGYDIHHRANNNGTWLDWVKILDTSTTYSANSSGNAVSVTCGTDATLATINDVAVKINVTKPTYTYSDVGAAPSSTVSCTTANVKTALGTGSGTTKFLREDGTWQTPAYIANTDEKVKVAALTSGTTYYPILATTADTATRQADTTLKGLSYISTAGTTSAVGTAVLALGNNTAKGTANNEQGVLRLYGTTAYYVDIKMEDGLPAANRTMYLPSYAGTMYMVAATTTNAVGSTTKPIYIDNTGTIQEGTALKNLAYIDKPSSNTTTTWLRGDGTWVAPPNDNTASAVDNILDGSNSGTAITYAPYSGQQAKLSFDVSTTDPTRTDRLNLNGNFHATNLYGDTAVIDNMVTLKYNTTDSALEFVFA